jgi:hypothetical protein
MRERKRGERRRQRIPYVDGTPGTEVAESGVTVSEGVENGR